MIRIGTSNIVLTGNKSTFPARHQNSSRLHYYSTLFNTVEINSSFYKITRAATLSKWAADVTPSFTFTIKLFKDFTHTKNLKTNYDGLIPFMHTIDALGNKKGMLLIQYPGKINVDYFAKVEELLQTIHEYSNWQKAIEFRNKDWYISETYEMLHIYNTCLVAQDIPKSGNSFTDTHSNTAYFRFHGPAGDYRGGYTNEFLFAKAQEMLLLEKQEKEVYAYFNNTIGDAFNNAKTLAGMIKKIRSKKV